MLRTKKHFFHFLGSFFDTGCLSNFVPYFLKVSICQASLDLFKITRNFDLSECAWDDIVFFTLVQVIFDKSDLSNFVPYFLKVSIFLALLGLLKTTRNFDLSECACGDMVIFTLFRAFIL